jgi:hypothetical protein
MSEGASNREWILSIDERENHAEQKTSKKRLEGVLATKKSR